jgi:hypothetical protein
LRLLARRLSDELYFGRSIGHDPGHFLGLDHTSRPVDCDGTGAAHHRDQGAGHENGNGLSSGHEDVL